MFKRKRMFAITSLTGTLLVVASNHPSSSFPLLAVSNNHPRFSFSLLVVASNHPRFSFSLHVVAGNCSCLGSVRFQFIQVEWGGMAWIYSISDLLWNKSTPFPLDLVGAERALGSSGRSHRSQHVRSERSGGAPRQRALCGTAETLKLSPISNP